MDIVLEHGGEDLSDEGDTWEIITEPERYEAVASAVKAAGIPTVMSEVTMVASTYTKLEGQRGEPDGAAAGGAGRAGRCAERALELRHGRRADGARGGISGPEAGSEEGRPVVAVFFWERAGNEGTQGLGMAGNDGTEGKESFEASAEIVLLVAWMAGTMMAAAQTPDAEPLQASDG